MSLQEADKMKTRVPEGWSLSEMRSEAENLGPAVILFTQWYPEVMEPMLASAQRYLQGVGVPVPKIQALAVPGSFELPLATTQSILKLKPSIVVALGCVIRGETPHFDYVCSAVSQGLMNVQLEHRVPVGFGVLTVDDLSQALARKDKGLEAAQAAFFMHLFSRRFGI
jgi:6,7-dimethyl-8-ribityllumazine synthase